MLQTVSGDLKPYYEKDRIKIFLGDFQEILSVFPESTFDAVITDPPYPKGYLPLWRPLAFQSTRVLKRGGSLLSIVPHYALPEILQTVGQHLKYRWTLCMELEGGPH